MWLKKTFIKLYDYHTPPKVFVGLSVRKIDTGDTQGNARGCTCDPEELAFCFFYFIFAQNKSTQHRAGYEVQITNLYRHLVKYLTGVKKKVETEIMR